MESWPCRRRSRLRALRFVSDVDEGGLAVLARRRLRVPSSVSDVDEGGLAELARCRRRLGSLDGDGGAVCWAAEEWSHRSRRDPHAAGCY